LASIPIVPLHNVVSHEVRAIGMNNALALPAVRHPVEADLTVAIDTADSRHRRT